MPITDDGRIDYVMPKVIKDKFTKEIISDFRDKVIEIFKQNDIRQGRKPSEYEKYSYYYWWVHMEITPDYNESFRYVCKKFGLNDVLEYYNKLERYDAAIFDGDFGELLVYYGLVELGNPEEANPDDDDEE